MFSHESGKAFIGHSQNAFEKFVGFVGSPRHKQGVESSNSKSDELYQLFLFQDVFDLLVKAYGADPRIRDNAGKTPRQYMVASSQLQGGDMQA